MLLGSHLLDVDEALRLRGLYLRQGHLNGQRAIVGHSRAQQLAVYPIRQHVGPRVLPMDLVSFAVVDVDSVDAQCVACALELNGIEKN